MGSSQGHRKRKNEELKFRRSASQQGIQSPPQSGQQRQETSVSGTLPPIHGGKCCALVRRKTSYSLPYKHKGHVSLDWLILGGRIPTVK